MERFATSWAAVALEEGAPSPSLLGRLVRALFSARTTRDFTVTSFGVRGRYRSRTERVVEGGGGGKRRNPNNERSCLSLSLALLFSPPPFAFFLSC